MTHIASGASIRHPAQAIDSEPTPYPSPLDVNDADVASHPAANARNGEALVDRP